MNQSRSNIPNIIVYLPSSEIRRRARASLAGVWTKAAVASLIYLAFIYVPASVLDVMFTGGLASSLYTLLVTGAFAYGYSLFIINLFRKEKADYTQLFDGFERVLKTIGLYLYINLFVCLWTFLFIIPGIIAAFRYSQSFYILIDNPDMTIPDIVNESKRMMRSNIAKLFCLKLSFIGWDILASLPSALFSISTVSAMTSALINSGMLDTVLESGNIGLGFSSVFAGSGSMTMFMFDMLLLALRLGYIFLLPYKETAKIVMYDIMKGRQPEVRTQL